MCFRFSNASWDVLHDNSLLSPDKTISSLLELIGHVFSISACFGKTLIAFDFDEQLTQSVAQVTVISSVKRLSSPALCGWSGAFNFCL